MKRRRAISIGYIAEFLEKLVDVFIVSCIRSGVTSRVHARPPTECLDDEPGVVGDRRQPGHRRGMPCLDQRVFDECLAGLIRFGHA